MRKTALLLALAAWAAPGPRPCAETALPPAAPKVVLDPAHGPGQPGVTAQGLVEADYVLEVAKACAGHLQRQRVDVILTRTAAQNISQAARVQMANAAWADAYVAIHLNGSFSAGSRGCRIFVAPDMQPAPQEPLPWKRSQRDSLPNSKKLARELARNLVPAARRSHAVQSLPMAAFRGLAVPGVVLELGFATHASDLEMFLEKGAARSTGEAVARGVTAALGLDWKD